MHLEIIIVLILKTLAVLCTKSASELNVENKFIEILKQHADILCNYNNLQVRSSMTSHTTQL